ncbi:uncharacterized protein BDZ99DRAFT_518899 [Mytilinidion resinicola]|uniref:RING-type domain-containing protein n=1 Tax=Mytilinidion resinicola TaxID=574789 RepID=A0A6A6YRT0_9PEZI|nr:uncharacterized protein BDZ99DRAFT_518899 [Mytilinidion resinicola]KAF2811646.1 hypothetical protein BDZ99DRAFT_518899 [Mytilinidion resinicola]
MFNPFKNPTPTRNEFTTNFNRYATFHLSGTPDSPDCVICTCPCGPKRPRMRLRDCQHDFCSLCFEKWLNSGQRAADKCVMCRKVLFVPDDETDSSSSEAYDSDDSLNALIDRMVLA